MLAAEPAGKRKAVCLGLRCHPSKSAMRPSVSRDMRTPRFTRVQRGIAIATKWGGCNGRSWRTCRGIIAIAVGAILDYAVTVNPDQHGFDVNKVGVILMTVGVVGVVLSLIAMLVANTRRHRTVVDDSQGNVVLRGDSTY